MLGPYASYVIDMAYAAMQAVSAYSSFISFHMPTFGSSERALLQQLQSRVVILPCDKANNNLACMCRVHATQVLLGDLYDGLRQLQPTFSSEQASVPAIIDTIDAQLLPLQLGHDQSALPVYTLMPKFHKPSLAFRFLSLSHTSRLKPAAVS